MKLGKFTFVTIINPDGKRSDQPLSYLLEIDLTGYTNASGETLELKSVGIGRAVALFFPSMFDRSVGKQVRQLTIGRGERLQGLPASSLKSRKKGQPAVVLASKFGDAPIVKVRGNSDKSVINVELFEVNATGTINGIYINKPEEGDHV